MNTEYKHLNSKKRIIIQSKLKQGCNLRAVARRLQQGQNIIELIWIVAFIAIVSLIIEFISEKYNFIDAFWIIFLGGWVIIELGKCLVRIYVFFSGKIHGIPDHMEEKEDKSCK